MLLTAPSSLPVCKALASPTHVRSTLALVGERSAPRLPILMGATASGARPQARGSLPLIRPGQVSSGPSARQQSYPQWFPTATARTNASSARRLSRLAVGGSAPMPSSSRCSRSGASSGFYPRSDTTHPTSGSSVIGSPPSVPSLSSIPPSTAVQTHADSLSCYNTPIRSSAASSSYPCSSSRSSLQSFDSLPSSALGSSTSGRSLPSDCPLTTPTSTTVNRRCLRQDERAQLPTRIDRSTLRASHFRSRSV